MKSIFLLLIFLLLSGCSKDNPLENYEKKKEYILKIDSLMRSKSKISVSILSDTTYDVTVFWEEDEIQKRKEINKSSLDSVILNESFKNSNWSRTDLEKLVNEIKNANCLAARRITDESDKWDFTDIIYERMFMRGDSYLIFREKPSDEVIKKYKSNNNPLEIRKIDERVYWELVGK